MDIVDLSGSLWGFMRADGWKSHFCPTSLMAGLLEDSNERGHELGILEKADKGFIDLPGMVSMNRTNQTIRIDTFDLTIPSQDYEYFFEELAAAQIRKFNTGQEYYKIHGWLACVVFTPEQRDIVLKHMWEQLPTVKVLAKKEDEEMTNAFKKINEGEVKVISHRDPESIKKLTKPKLVSKPNNEKN